MPLDTVAVPIEDPLRITLIVEPVTPVPVTVVTPAQYVPVIAGAADTAVMETPVEATLTHLLVSV